MPDGYSLLPTVPNGTSSSASFAKWVPSIRPRQFLTILSSLALSLTFISLFYLGDFKLFAYPERSQWASNATNFDEIFLKEALLPQHDLSAPYPEGRDGRFVRFSNQVWGLGWNNLLQERLLNTILAYESNRAPVFSPFEAWAHPPRDDSKPTGGRQVLVVPYNALLSGPTAGASWGPGDHHPRAISQKWWETVCPFSRRKVINADDIMKQIGKDSDGLRMLEEWVKLLDGIPDSCVEIVGTQVFDFFLLGSTRILSLWDKFSKHPTVQQLSDSSVATVALAQNMHKLQSWSKLSWRPSAVKSTGVISGLVAIHIRRGDYLGEEGKNNGHCVGLSDWGSSFTGWNQLTQLADKFDPPPRGEGGQNTPEVKEYYLKRCLPTPAQVTARLHALRAEQQTPLVHVFVATNAEPTYLAELRDALAADGWDPKGIVTSSELELNWQATSANVAVDMAIMSRAEVFVGNGFSSLSSNVVMKRLTSGMTIETTRLW